MTRIALVALMFLMQQACVMRVPQNTLKDEERKVMAFSALPVTVRVLSRSEDCGPYFLLIFPDDPASTESKLVFFLEGDGTSLDYIRVMLVNVAVKIDNSKRVPTSIIDPDSQLTTILLSQRDLEQARCLWVLHNPHPPSRKFSSSATA